MIKKITFLLVVLNLVIGQLTHAQTVPQLWGTCQNEGLFLGGTIFKINGDGNGYQVANSFSAYTTPNGNLVQYTDNKLYGVCPNGIGSSSSGSIYSFDPSTGICTDEYDLVGSNGGEYPYGNLAVANNLLYGFTYLGGNDNVGIMFSFNPSTSTFNIVHNFTDTSGCSSHWGGFTLVADSLLYGVTPSGGLGYGVIFAYNINSNTYRAVYKFTNASGGGTNPNGKLIYVNGKLYGMTTNGGANGDGVIYSFDPSTTTYTDIVDFSGKFGSYSGATPYGALTYRDGVLWGMTSAGGGYGDGAIFNYNLSTSTYTDIHDFNTSVDGYDASGSLYLASDSNFYGLVRLGAPNGWGEIFKYDIDSSTFRMIYQFDQTSNDGVAPQADLMEWIPVTSTGVKQSVVNNNQLSIYPNPSTGLVTITC